MEKGHVEFSINWKGSFPLRSVQSPEVHISPVSNGKITPKKNPAGHVSAAGLGLSGFPGRQEMDLPSGKHTKNYGKIHHFQWVNPLFRLGHFQ